MNKEKQIDANKYKATPLDLFFKLGDKVTKGDPKRKADFDYYMLWIIFLAFFGVFFGNLMNFIKLLEWQYLGWALFGLAIMWFQYFNLKNMRTMRKLQKEQEQQPKKEIKVESVKDMLKGFEE